MIFDAARRAERAALLDPEDDNARVELQKQRARYGLDGFVPRPYQLLTIEEGIRFAEDVRGNPTPETTRRIFVLPCGAGKSLIQLEIAARLRARGLSVWILTPSIEIIKGYLEALGESIDGSNETMAKRAFALGITTGKRFANRLAKAVIGVPDVLIIDEVHQWLASNATPETIFAMLPRVPALGFTATPFRATRKGTIAFREQWGEPDERLTHREAVARGFVLMPNFHIRPLVDDANVRIVNGELDPGQVSGLYQDQMRELCDLIAEVAPSGPTAVSVTSTPMAHVIAENLTARGMTPGLILQDTPGGERRRLYAEVSANRCILIQLRVLSVGADIPALTNLIDAQPTMSPVLFLQTYGRVCRLDKANPGKVANIYVTNRNVERFGWLYEGAPGVQDAVIATQQGFEGPNPRGGGRLFGFERLERFKVFNAELERGGFMQFYNVVSKEAGPQNPIYHEHIIALHPSGRVRAAKRQTGQGIPYSDPRAQWREVPLPSELCGMSTPKARMDGWSDKQGAAWERNAARVGLRPARPGGDDSRVLQVLFAALNVGWRY